MAVPASLHQRPNGLSQKGRGRTTSQMFDEQKLFLSEKVRLDLVHAVILHLTTTYNMCEGIQLI